MEKISSIYCENFTNSFLTNQPINTITNIVFFIAGILLIKLYRESKIKSVGILTMIILVFLVGIGSTVWHFSETLLGKILDIAPISLLVITYFVLFLKKVSKTSLPYVIIMLIFFIGLNPLCLQIFEKEPLRSSAGYFPVLLMLALQTLYTFKKNNPIYKNLFLAFLTFSLALIFRSIDLMLCNAFPVGTHFLWHILNGFLVYLIVKALIKHETASTP